MGNQAGIAASLSRLAGIALVEGHFEEAEHLARESVATARQGGLRTELALALMSLGEVLEVVAKFPEAYSVLQQSLVIFNDLGHRHYITETHQFLSSVELHRGRYEEARVQAQTSLELARAQGPPYCVGLNLLLLGCLALAEGVHTDAHHFLQEAADALQGIGGNLDGMSWAQVSLALAAHGLGDRSGARQHLCHAFEFAQESGVALPLLWALPVMALLLAGEGEHEHAVELYALACRFPLVAQSRWFADVLGKRNTAAANTLPDNRVSLLQERDQARDLESTASELLTELSGARPPG